MSTFKHHRIWSITECFTIFIPNVYRVSYAEWQLSGKFVPNGTYSANIRLIFIYWKIVNYSANFRTTIIITNGTILTSVEDEISEEKWLKALKKTKPKSAPGPSDISYPLIKKAGTIAQKIFRHLANLCIREGEILSK